MKIFAFKKKKKQVSAYKYGKVQLAMPILNNETIICDLYKIIDHLKSYWNVTVTEINNDINKVVFTIQGEIVALAPINVIIPWAAIQKISLYAPNRPSLETNLKITITILL